MPTRAATSAAVATAPWRRRNDGVNFAGRRVTAPLFAPAELATLPGINQPDHAFIVIGAAGFAERLPLLDALLLGGLVFRFLRIIARLIGRDRGPAGPAVELAVGAGGD